MRVRSYKRIKSFAPFRGSHPKCHPQPLRYEGGEILLTICSFLRISDTVDDRVKCEFLHFSTLANITRRRGDFVAFRIQWNAFSKFCVLICYLDCFENTDVWEVEKERDSNIGLLPYIAHTRSAYSKYIVKDLF